MQRRRVKQTDPLGERLRQRASDARARAGSLPPGSEKDALLLEACEAETALNIDAWLSSPRPR
jgi:hypothetical protein